MKSQKGACILRSSRLRDSKCARRGVAWRGPREVTTARMEEKAKSYYSVWRHQSRLLGRVIKLNI